MGGGRLLLREGGIFLLGMAMWTPSFAYLAALEQIADAELGVAAVAVNLLVVDVVVLSAVEIPLVIYALRLRWRRGPSRPCEPGWFDWGGAWPRLWSPSAGSICWASDGMGDLTVGPESQPISEWKGDAHGGPPSRLAVDGDRAGVGLDELGDDGQADAAAGRLASLSGPPETVEDVRDVVGRDPDTGIVHRDPGVVVDSAHVEVDLASGGGELEGVGQQVCHHLMQAVTVAVDRQVIRRGFEAQPGGMKLLAKAPGGVEGHLPQINGRGFEVEPGRVGGGERFKVLDDPDDTKDVVAQRRQRGARRLDEAIGHGLQGCLQHAEGGSQLVRDVGDEGPAQVVFGRQRVGHPVERDGQFAHLAGGVEVAHPRRAVPSFDGSGGIDQGDDRAGDPPGDTYTHREGDHGGQPCRRHDRACQGIAQMPL